MATERKKNNLKKCAPRVCPKKKGKKNEQRRKNVINKRRFSLFTAFGETQPKVKWARATEIYIPLRGLTKFSSAQRCKRNGRTDSLTFALLAHFVDDLYLALSLPSSSLSLSRSRFSLLLLSARLTRDSTRLLHYYTT